jgi:uncharacterized protein YhbP (UPF0306 family)
MLIIVSGIMEDRILAYIDKNKVLTIATAVAGVPYCANCFYAYDQERQTLIFLSDDATRHIQEAFINKQLAGTIQNGVTTVAQIQGIQFTGEFIPLTEEVTRLFYANYYAKFPFAKARPSPIWAIQINWLKMTDNTLGFGKKLLWERN